MSDIVDFIEFSSSSTCEDSSINVQLDDEIDENQEQENPFQSFIRLQNCQSNYNDRKNSIKYILDALRSVGEIDQIQEILLSTKKLAEDSVVQVQIDCLEKFLPIIEYLVENVVEHQMLIREYLFLSIIETIGHGNNRIRKSSQSCLIRLFELNIVEVEQINDLVVPGLCNLDRACDDFKNESILLMTRLIPFVPSEFVSEQFLKTIVHQSSSVAFQIRKTCASSLAELVNVLPCSIIDKEIVPCLSQLCSDSFWGVRKSCAEVIHPVGQHCSDESRWNILSPCLIQLLQDQSRWVKTAALRVLGYFISTFSRQNNETNKEETKVDDKTSSIDENVKFNDFHYWRDFNYLSTSIDDQENSIFDRRKIPFENISIEDEKDKLRKSKEYPITDVRRILPMDLLDFYRNLIEQSYSSGVETDIVHQGAFTLPAVALTIGNKHWNLIKDVHKKFCEDLQWKVRRTLSFSLHCLAQMLTDEQVELDLCPIFDSFIRDVDEVKIGILCNLSKFFERLKLSTKRIYLDKLVSLTTVDNQRNWRFRFETANQLSELTVQFDCDDVCRCLTPLLLTLSKDRVFDVRQSSIKALSRCYLKYREENRHDLAEQFIDECEQLFCLSTDWKLRQSFINLVQSIYHLQRDDQQEISLVFIVKLISLVNDPVVNVRLILAKFLIEDLILKRAELTMDIKLKVNEAIEILSSDRDRDVLSTIFKIKSTEDKYSHQIEQ